MSGERYRDAPAREAFSTLLRTVPDDTRAQCMRLLESIVFKYEMYEFTGFKGVLSGAAAAPTTTNLPASGEWCYWQNTGDSKVYHAVNYGGTIYTVEMT